MSITRRDLFNRAAPVTLSVCALSLAEWGGLSAAIAAEAKTTPPPPPNLMDPGPFPDWALGSSTAPVTVVEYSSMTCSHCAEFAITTFPDFKKEFIDTGKVRYIAREFPLDELAAAATMLTRSVGEDRYYSVLDTLFQKQRQWLSNRIQPLMTLAVTALQFTEDSFNACLADQHLLDLTKQAYDRAQKLDVTATPSFFVNGEKVASGYMTLKQMENQIARRLKS